MKYILFLVLVVLGTACADNKNPDLKKSEYDNVTFHAKDTCLVYQNGTYTL